MNLELSKNEYDVNSNTSKVFYNLHFALREVNLISAFVIALGVVFLFVSLFPHEYSFCNSFLSIALCNRYCQFW